MLKGKELGDAIRAALAENGKMPADAARYFEVKPPSVSGWMATGRISKDNFNRLVAWLDKTPMAHWGTYAVPQSSFGSVEQRGFHPSNVAALTFDSLESHLKAVSEYLKLLDDDGRVIASAALGMFAKSPENYGQAASAIQGMLDRGNDSAAKDRLPKSISSKAA